MSPPSWVDYRTAERNAAVSAREFTGATEAWGTVLTHAQAVLASRTDTRAEEHLDSYEFSEWHDLVAAARILDLAATESGLRDADARSTAAVLAACAFGMSGTAVSAAATIESHRLLASDLSPSELVALALSAPMHSSKIFPDLGSGTAHRSCVENLAAFLATGDGHQMDAATGALDDIIRDEPSSWGGYLLRLGRLSLSHAKRLSTARVLRAHESQLPFRYVDRLTDDSPLLLPSQYEAISRNGILSPSTNLLITLPTGTGKTLLGELALLGSLGREPGLVCYIAPYVALGRQVYDKITRHTRGTPIRVHRLVGGYREPVSIEPDDGQEVVIATPERFDALMRIRPDLLGSIRCIVFDEAHMIGNGQRGIRLEGIITRLRLAALGGTDVPRFILLSAVLSNSDDIAQWIGVDPKDVIRGTWRPSAKRLLRWTEDGKLRLHAGDDPLRADPKETLGERLLPWPHEDFLHSDHFGVNRKQEPRVLQNVAYLARFQHAQYRQPVLCVCATRAKTRHLANHISQDFSLLEPLPASILAISTLIDQRYPYLRPLKEALHRGVAYHNSSLPHDVREGIEEAVADRALRVVTATTTLAEGVDLPFRVTILADWITFDGAKNRPMESLLFKNIAGRCGRAGQFTEGDTIIFDNPVGSPQLTSPARRPRLQDEVFFADSQPAVRSSFVREDKQEAISAIGSQLLAAIGECPELDDLSSTFFEFSFARHSTESSQAAERIRLAFADILDDSDGEPLAIAASPASLTEFGVAANQGGLSPGSARQLRDALRELKSEGSDREDLIEIGVKLLRSMGDVTEQGNHDFRRAVANPKSRPAVRLDELEQILDSWLAGESIETIFASLPRIQRSRRKPNLESWLKGVTEDSTWTDEFAKFHDFVRECLEFFLPWLLRAAQTLMDQEGETNRPWRQWAQFIEFGVDSPWGAFLREERVLADRSLARLVGRRLDQLERQPTSKQVTQIAQETLGDDSQLANQLIAWFSLRPGVAPMSFQSV